MTRIPKAAARCVRLMLLLAAAAAGASAAQERLLVRVWPTVAQAPATVRINVLVQPDERNRTLVIAVDSGAYYRSSVIALDGARAPRFHSVLYASLPDGVYDVRVALVTETGEARAVEHAVVQIAP